MGELIDLSSHRASCVVESRDSTKTANYLLALGFVAADIAANPTASCTEADIRTAEVLQKLFRDGLTDKHNS